jgi:hypothetical protein
MQRNATQSKDSVVPKPNVFNPVFNRNRKRVRGIWIRNGVFYVQVRIADQVKQVLLHDASTIAQAIRERQALKSSIAKGEYPPKPESTESVQPLASTPASKPPPIATQPNQPQPEHTLVALFHVRVVRPAYNLTTRTGRWKARTIKPRKKAWNQAPKPLSANRVHETLNIGAPAIPGTSS